MKDKFMLIRGKRIQQQIESEQERLDEDSSFIQLSRNIERSFNTTKREHSTQPIHLQEINFIPYVEDMKLMVDAVASSEQRNVGSKEYDVKIMFSDVIFEKEDTGQNVTLMASDGETYNIMPIKLIKSNIKVNCTCMDFRWRFSMWNHKDGSLYGDPPPPYKKKTNRPPVNPDKVPGVCKHLLKTVEAMQDSKLVVP